MINTRNSKSSYYFLIISVSILFMSFIAHSKITEKRQFTAKDNHLMKRMSGTVLSPDSKFVAYSVRVWDDVTGKASAHLEFTNIGTGETGKLTNEGFQDNTPLFSADYPEYLFFMSNRNEKSSLWVIPFKPEVGRETFDEPKLLKDYPVDIENPKIQSSTFVFSTETYLECTTLQCVAERKNKENPDWATYDQMFVRHWDEWGSDRVNHIFVNKITKDANGAPTIIQEPVDVMLGINSNCPIKPFGGSELFDISPLGDEIVYTRFDRTHDESWKTDWKTYTVKLDANSVPSAPENHYHITQINAGRTQNPKYSKDGRKIAYLSMNRPGLESDNLLLEVFNFFTYKVEKIHNANFDLSIVDFAWYDDQTIIFIATELGYNKLFKIYLDSDKDLDKKEYTYTVLTNDITNSHNLPMNIPGTKKFVAVLTSYLSPDYLVTYSLDVHRNSTPLEEKDLTVLTNVNKEFLENFAMSEFTSFTYQGFEHEVQGFVMYPLGFDATASKKYPLAFLIHGGPEGAWESSWSYRWNPQLWAHRGYAAVMINPSGSTGMGIKFQDAVRDSWGGAPYQDLMKGFEHLKTAYPWIDTTRACGVGASFGGYMVNWIQGNSKNFKCLVTHDGVFSTLTMYYATEEVWFPHAEYCPHDNVGCKPFDPKFRDRYEIWSPETKVGNWSTPHLIIHGSKDYRIPISEGIAAYNALQYKGIPSKFLHFNEENHWVLKPEHSILWYDEVLGWLDKYTEDKPQ